MHIDKDAATAKVWLHDATVARSIGFSAQDLGKIQRMVKSHQSSLKEAWNAFFRKIGDRPRFLDTCTGRHQPCSSHKGQGFVPNWALALMW